VFAPREELMPLTLTWHDIALRLALSIMAGAAIGLDRGEHGHPAGLRTTMLVCLASAVAMIQANLLLATTGKAADSFVTFDIMRLPLGILTGMGFIGGGAIMRRDGFVIGVTTAATLWFVTVMGLCFGGGQIRLGIAAFVLGMLVLSVLRWFDTRMKQEQHGVLNLITERDEPKQETIRGIVQRAGYKISVASVGYISEAQQREIEFKLQWRSAPQILEAPPFLEDLLSNPHVVTVRWKVS
jgi:putative Mg2+ transporter-C (MgtC) family protein